MLKAQIIQPVPQVHVSWKNMVRNNPLSLIPSRHLPEKTLGSTALDQQPSCVA